jgi:RNA polymerase sigma-70 factor, ECF subfamily
MELLIKQAQTGDKEAFIQAINEYMSQMYKVAKTRLKSEEDIGDAIQDTILSAYKDLSKLRQLCYFRTWIIKILINKCNDIVQRNSKLKFVEDYTLIHDTNITVNNSFEEQLDFKEILDTLSTEYRTVITLYYINGFTTREIAEILKEKEGTIKSKLSRARQKLKSYYLDEREVEKGLNHTLEVTLNEYGV